MTLRERILAVYQGDTPDVVPFMLDLSHWYYHRTKRPWDLTSAYLEPEHALIDEHERLGAGFYMPNLGSFFETTLPEDVTATATRSGDGSRITWAYETPLGRIERTRVWEEQTYAWGIAGWGMTTEADLRVLQYALQHRRYEARWDRYEAWVERVGDLGVVYLPIGYSAMGRLLNYWLGIEGTVYATIDWHASVREFIDTVNANQLDLVDLAAQSPAEVVIMGDNFSSDIQPPHFFDEWSRPYYEEAVRRLHAAGKYVAVHIDGKLRGSLAMIRDTGADCADAVTPPPMGDLTAAECRDEAGEAFILSGGVSPDLWLPGASLEAFKAAVRDWLDLRRRSPRLIANAGDQVPPGADEDRIAIMRDLVETGGRL